MKKINVDLPGAPYPIIIGAHLLQKAAYYTRQLNLGSDPYIITNPNIKRKYGSQLAQSFLRRGCKVKFAIIADSEKSKSMETFSCLVKDIAGYDKQRKVFVAALGGGVVGDVAGFVASVYKRGIPYIQIPTTLLAQVDSAIGGKTGIDLKEGKNLVGSFYQPRLVLSDIELLRSLDSRQIKSGLAEVVKYGIICDRALFVYLEKNWRKVLALDTGAMEYIIARCSRIKARIVEIDEKEKKGLRTILNFGHTIGHAIEAASGYTRYTHGEAVALGMLAAAGMSREAGLLKESEVGRIENLIANISLPVTIHGVSLAAIIAAHYHDKKFSGGRNRFVLIREIGKAVVKENVPLPLVRAAVKERM